MAKNQIAMGINLRKQESVKSPGYGKYYPEVDCQKTLSLKGFAKHLVDHGSIYSQDIVEGVLRKITQCLPELVSQGVPVQLEPLGTFYPSAKVAKDKAIILSPEPGMSSADNVPDSRNKLMGTNIGQTLIGGEPVYGTPVNQTGIQDQFSVLALSRNKNGDVGFFGYTGERLPPFKAYILCNWTDNNSSSLAFSVVIDDTIDEPSAIQETEASFTSRPSQPGWYSLDGRSLKGQPTTPGIYIKNGRKVVIQ